MKRSLILAGGGMKVGYQAGALQVLLDEAGLEFDHADGTSGGVFNLAMLQSGLTGTEIANNWRKVSPLGSVSLQRLYRYLLPWRLPSLMTYSRFRRKVLPAWGVDFEKIRRSPIEGTYNVLNFTDKRFETYTESDITPDIFFACVSLPMFFPAAQVGDKIYIDGVFYKDANLNEAVRRGADEIWVIWTVNETPDYRNGFYRQYFHIIEAIADSHFYDEQAEIEGINEEVRAGRDSEHRDIKVHVIRHQEPVPLDYLIYFRASAMSRIVDLGIEDARRYLKEAGIPFRAPPAARLPAPLEPVGLEFTEEMRGYWCRDEEDPRTGDERGQEQGSRLDFRLTVVADDLDRFLDEPEHAARATGYVDCPELGGHCPVESGEFNLFVKDAVAGVREMRYTLPFKASDGATYLLLGVKEVRDDPGMDLWTDTTTLFTRIHGGGTTDGPIIGSGVLRLPLQNLARQLTTFRVHNASGRVAEAKALARFGAFFFGELWDGYVRPLFRLRGRG